MRVFSGEIIFSIECALECVPVRFPRGLIVEISLSVALSSEDSGRGAGRGVFLEFAI